MGRKRPASASPAGGDEAEPEGGAAGTGGRDEVEPEGSAAGTGGRKRRRPQSIQPGTGTGPVTRSRSMAPGSDMAAPAGGRPVLRRPDLIFPMEGSKQAQRRRVVCVETSVAAPSSQGEVAAGDPIGALLVTPAPPSASTAGGGEELTAPTSPAGGEKVESMGAFVANTPLSMPYLEVQDSNGKVCEEPSDPDSELVGPYWSAEEKYNAKLDEIWKLPTLDSDTATSPDITQESKADTILKASEFVFGLSSYDAGKLLRKCSGILIEWSNGTGTILTTTKLVCSKSPNVDEWLGGDEYAPEAEVRVRLLRKDAEGKLTYLDKQYGFALVSVVMDKPKRLARLCNEQVAEDVFLLGRNESNLQIRNGKVLSKGTGRYERHHYMYTDGHISLFGAGGAVINFEGDVTGMITSPIHFIPSSIIIKCLEILKTYKCVPRVHLGMSLLGIKCLNIVSKEKIYREYDVGAGLIVQMVSTKSDAEGLGIRIGDIILSVNGRCIATAVELENELLEISKAQLKKGISKAQLKKGTVPGGPNADVMLTLNVLNTTRCVRGTLELRATLSNEEEILKEGKHAVVCKRRPKVSSPDAPSS